MYAHDSVSALGVIRRRRERRLSPPNPENNASGEEQLLPPSLKAPVPVTNLAEFGYGTSVATSKLVFAIMAHDGAGIASNPMPNGLHGWNSSGAITPIKRYAQMLSGYPLQNVDGTEWYFPQRLTDDSAAIDNGNANPAQAVFGIKDTMGHKLSRHLLMYAFGAYGGPVILQATIALDEPIKALEYMFQMSRPEKRKSANSGTALFKKYLNTT